MMDNIILASQKAGEALRNSCADGPRKEWGDQLAFISGPVHDDGTTAWLYLNLAGLDAFEETVDRLLKESDFAQTVGRNAIVLQLAGFLRRCNGTIPGKKLLGPFVKEVVEPLQQSIYNWTCLIPLVNFRIQESLTIGDVTFVSKENAYEELKGIAGTVQAVASLGELECVEDEDRVDAFAKANVKAHEMRLVRHAEETVLVAINMLRAFAPRLNPFGFALLCGLRTEVPRSGRHSVLSIGPGAEVTYIRHEDDGSVLGNFMICEETLRQLREECEFEALISIVKKPLNSRTTLESRIFASVQTLGQSMVLGSIGPAFSGCIAALECLVILEDQRYKIKETFATNMKGLFGNYRKAAEAYALRSDFVHTGLADIAVKDLRTARCCAIDLIVLALSNVKGISEHANFLSQCLNS